MIIYLDGKEERNAGETKKTIEAISKKLNDMLRMNKNIERKE